MMDDPNLRLTVIIVLWFLPTGLSTEVFISFQRLPVIVMDDKRRQLVQDTRFYEGAPLYYSDHVPYTSSLFDLDNHTVVGLQNECQPDVGVDSRGPELQQHPDNVGHHHEQGYISYTQGAHYHQEQEYTYRQPEGMQLHSWSHSNGPRNSQQQSGLNFHGYPEDCHFQHIPSRMDLQQGPSNLNMPPSHQGQHFGKGYPIGPNMDQQPSSFGKPDINFERDYSPMPSHVHPIAHHHGTAPNVHMHPGFQHFPQENLQAPSQPVPPTKRSSFPNPMPSHYIPGSQNDNTRQGVRNSKEMCPPIHPTEFASMQQQPSLPYPNRAPSPPHVINIKPIQPQQNYREWQVTIRETTLQSKPPEGKE